MGAAAIMASCSQEELIPNETTQKVAKGIVFEAAENNDSATRGEMDRGEDGQHRFIWYAEQDRINIYASNVKATESNTTDAGVADAKFTTLNPAVYKATKSGSFGLFTAEDDANWIAFANDEKIRVIATYNATLAKVTASDKTIKINNIDTKVTDVISEVKLDAVVPATIVNQPLNVLSAPMLSITEGAREKTYNSVGEKMNLDFTRIFPTLYFSGVAGNDSFNNDLGKLQSVTITTKGGDSPAPAEGYDALSATNIAGTAEYTYKPNTNKVHNYTISAGSSEISVTVGETWTSDKGVYVNILPISRTITKAGKPNKQATEKYDVTYNYENASLRKHLNSSKNWDEPHKVYKIESLNIETDFPYIVVNNIVDEIGTVDGLKLIVNQGSAKDAFKGDYIVWEASPTTQNIGGKIYNVVAASDIKAIEVRSGANALTADDYAQLNKLTNVAKLVVKNDTEKITYNALSNLNNLAYLEMDNVTAIEFTNQVDKNTPVNTVKLATVKLPAFDFSANKEITTAILNSAVLTTLDMSGTPSMMPVFPYDGMSLAGYDKLATVTVKDGVVLGPESFMGCSALETINGYVTLGGYGAFKNCIALETISIDMAASTKIWDETFMGATSLENVFDKDKKTAIKPAIIGNKAFQGTMANIDLTATTTIGASAFKGNTALMGAVFGAAGSDKYQLVVSATSVGEGAFEGATGLQYVKFTNLQTVSKSMLAGTTMKELKFVNLFTFAEGAGNKVFGTTANTTLYVKPGQEYSANTISVNGSKITFKTIVEE